MRVRALPRGWGLGRRLAHARSRHSHAWLASDVAVHAKHGLSLTEIWTGFFGGPLGMQVAAGCSYSIVVMKVWHLSVMV